MLDNNSFVQNILNAKILDEVQLCRRTVSPGGVYYDVKGYFKSFDWDNQILHLWMYQDRTAEIIVSPKSVQWIKSATTGEMVYEMDPRNMVLGRSL